MKLNKIFFISLMVLFLTVSFVSAVVDYDSDVLSFTPLFDTIDDDTGLIDSSGNSKSYIAVGSTQINDSYYEFSDNNDYIYNSTQINDVASITVWAKFDEFTTANTLVDQRPNTGDNKGWYFLVDATTEEIHVLDDTGSTSQHCYSSGVNLNTDTWYNIGFSINGGSSQFYINGVATSMGSCAITSTTKLSTSTENVQYRIGAPQTLGTNNLDGGISDVWTYDKSLSTAEMLTIYNEGRNYNPYVSSSNLTLTIVDEWNNSLAVNNVSALIDGYTFSNTTGNVIYTNISLNVSETKNIYLGGENYFPKYYASENIGANLELSLFQSVIDFTTTEYISGDTLTGINYTIDGQQNTTFHLYNGSYTVTAEKTGYYSLNHTFNVSALDNRTEVVEGLYNTILNITLNDIVTSDLIEANSYLLINNSEGYEELFSAVNGSLFVNLIQGNYSLTAWADDYAFVYADIVVNSTTFNATYSLYSNNSLWVTAINFGTGASLTNFSVEVFDVNSSYNADSVGGVAKIDNITSGVYTVRVTKDLFSVGEYALTMTGGSHQNLIAYLVSSGTETIFTVVDSISSGIIEGAQGSMYKTINGTWTLVSSQNSDITGRIQYSYVGGISYKFVFDADDYEQRTFFLKPLFSSYTIRLTPDVVSVADENTGSYVYEINNSGLFYDGVNNSFSVSLTSGTGTLEYYNLTATNFDGSAVSVNCSVANGCSDDFSFVIAGATFADVVTVEYWVKESGRSTKYFKNVYHVQDTYDAGTLQSWKDVDDGDVDDLSKAFVAMLICLIVVGFVSVGSIMVGVPPVTISGIVLGVLVELLAYVDFIPNSAGHLVALGCLLIVLFGRGEI